MLVLNLCDADANTTIIYAAFFKLLLISMKQRIICIIQGSEKLATVLQAKEARHKEDDTGHNHGDAVFEQDDAPDSRIDVLRLLVWIDGHIPDLVLDEWHIGQDECQYDRKH